MIPDDAVEAAAVAWTRLMCGCYDPEDVPHLHDELRRILEAAAPLMLREAWDDGHAEGVDYADGMGRGSNPYEVSK